MVSPCEWLSDVDQLLLVERLNAGYGRAATFLGRSVRVYRPDGRQPLIPALDSRYAILETPAWFNPDPRMRQVRPAAAEKPVVFSAIDGTQVQQGDYLVGPEQNTWFVGSIQALLAIPCVRCNRAFTVTRAVAATGANAYGGNAPAAMTTVLTGWPGFVTAKPRGIGAEERVPGDTKLDLVLISLPVTPGAEILPNDVIIDDQARPMRYTASLASATGWGWTIEAYYAGA